MTRVWPNRHVVDLDILRYVLDELSSPAKREIIAALNLAFPDVIITETNSGKIQIQRFK